MIIGSYFCAIKIILYVTHYNYAVSKLTYGNIEKNEINGSRLKL